jgi:hypothetical protein
MPCNAAVKEPRCRACRHHQHRRRNCLHRLAPAPDSPSLACESWEHLLDGGRPLVLSLQDCRQIRQAQHAEDSLDLILYGRLDVRATQANVDKKGP